MAEQNKRDSEFNIFIANSIYPQADQIFSFRPKTLEEIKRDCLVVLDTNALLVPYNTGKKSLQQIKDTYRRLVAAKRLIIPGQVAREFAKNRADKIGQLFQQVMDNNSQKFVPMQSYPLLEALDQYQEAHRLAEEILGLQKAYKKALAGLLDHIQDWMWNDPISLLYGELFANGVVLDEPWDEEEIRRDLARRISYHIPPGYKDAGKEDSGIGDLLIWHTIMRVGEKHQKSVLFVSGDEKPDWWTRGANQALYPRYELISEFARHSGGESFHIIRFSRLLELYGADETVVAEVQQEENVIRVATSKSLSALLSALGAVAMVSSLTTTASTAKLRVYQWLAQKYPGSKILVNAAGSPDFWMLNEDGSKVAVKVHHINDPGKLSGIPSEAFLQHYVISNESGPNKFIVVIVVPQGKVPEMVTPFLSLQFDTPSTEAVLGYVDPNNEFTEVAPTLGFNPQ